MLLQRATFHTKQDLFVCAFCLNRFPTIVIQNCPAGETPLTESYVSEGLDRGLLIVGMLEGAQHSVGGDGLEQENSFPTTAFQRDKQKQELTTTIYTLRLLCSKAHFGGFQSIKILLLNATQQIFSRPRHIKWSQLSTARNSAAQITDYINAVIAVQCFSLDIRQQISRQI